MALPARRTAGRHRIQPTSSPPAGPPINATRVITPGSTRQDPAHRAQAWLRNAMAALAILATAAAVVSWQAQYVLVWSVKHTTVIAALEAGIPDVGSLIFAALGIALALHGKRALRARTLNLGCVGLSLGMNALASRSGWRDLAIWIMPAVVYALASDTLIGVIRVWVIARTQHTGQVLTDDEATPMAVLGGFILWLLRLVLAPLSTLAGFRRWALDECPVAPGRKAPRSAVVQKLSRRAGRTPRTRPAVKPPGKQAQMLALAGQRHDLTTLPLKQVSGVANSIGAEVDLSPGTARRVLLDHVRTLQNGHQQKGPR
jgi:hypothetical protein